jgi:hypothetical protein
MISNPKRLSANSARKGRKLHAEGKVWFIPDGRVYVVEGEHGIYPAVVIGDLVTCLCPHHAACSHQHAIRIARRPGEQSARSLDVATAVALLHRHDDEPVLPISIPTST